MPALDAIPKFADLFLPALKALENFGGSASLQELDQGVSLELRLSDEALGKRHVRNRNTSREEVTNGSEFSYRLRWALTYLKRSGYVTNSVRGVWALTELGKTARNINPKQVISSARHAMAYDSPKASQLERELEGGNDQEDQPTDWRDEMLVLLLKLEPSAFERLTQRVLREAGFEEVEVTGRAGDGGIDGRGIVRINDLINLSAIFQCKRYKSAVGPSEVREFRGAMHGRADRGIFVTTSSFTPAAIKEANRDGVTPIDLIDGDRLIDLLKRLALGITTTMIEQVSIDYGWFNAI